MKSSGELRRQAERYQRLKRQISDPAALQAICELADEFDMTAEEVEKRGARAHYYEAAAALVGQGPRCLPYCFSDQVVSGSLRRAPNARSGLVS